jgi:NADPH:quinone reductase-like Zn-dependent oxidoreductase
MKTWRLTGSGFDNLNMGDEHPGEPGPGEVQVAIRAAAINFRDVGVVDGTYPAAANLVPFSDGAGAVVALGAGVGGFEVGDAVVTCFYENWQGGRGTPENRARSFGSERDGVLAELVNLPASGLVKKPVSLDFAEASTLTCAGLTAWTALFREGGLVSGQHVVVQGTGGVAIFALQFAKMIGATVTVLSSSDAKLERVRAMGADHLVNYRTAPAWSDAVRAFTGGRGAEVVVELGGPQTFPLSQACLAMEGTIAIIGLLTGIDAGLSIPMTIGGRQRIHGITVGHREDMLAMNRAIDLNGIKPVIDSRYALDDAKRAYQDLPKGQHFGKLVVEVAG